MGKADPDEITNDERASWAAVALLAYGGHKEFIGEEIGDDEAPYLIVEELLADLAHWCDRNGVNLQGAIQHATRHYRAETGSQGMAARPTRHHQITCEEPAMADLDGTKKVHLYRLLYRLNLSFAAIVRRCREFQQTRLFNSKDLTVYQGLARELQADINQCLLEALHQNELDDWARYGKVSAAREKELRDPDDVFIAAKQRRREKRKKKGLAANQR